jgi:hypothetical protein
MGTSTYTYSYTIRQVFHDDVQHFLCSSIWKLPLLAQQHEGCTFRYYVPRSRSGIMFGTFGIQSGRQEVSSEGV